MAQSTVATQVQQAFAIHGDFAAQFALNLMVAINFVTEHLYLAVAQVFQAASDVNLAGETYLLSLMRSNAKNIR